MGVFMDPVDDPEIPEDQYAYLYKKPIVKIKRNSIIDQKPSDPICLNPTAQGKRKAISKSNIMNNIATR